MFRVLAVVVLCLALPSTAAAGTVAKAGTSIVWTGTAEADAVTIERVGDTVVVTDAVATTPGDGCTAVEPPDPTKAQCPWVEGDSATAAAGEQNDTVTCGGLPCTLNGEGGDDTLIGGVGAQTLAGGPGIDTASYADRANGVTVDADGQPDDGETGEADNVETDIEQIVGGAGQDTFLDAAGAQTYAGGDESDTASYASAPDGVALSLDGVANDGPENDDIEADVENLIGGAGADVLTGSAAPNRLEGGGGGDTIDGVAEADDLVGGDGTDGLAGGGGDDTLDGGVGADDLVGGDGTDGLVGGGGDDTLDGGVGADDLLGGDGTDELGGGEGADRLDGGPGDDDELVGGEGPDVLGGGAGVRDEASYAERTVRVEAVLGGGPVSGGEVDGPVGARDVLGSDVERLVGGSGPDRLTDTGGPHGLEGGPGDDTIVSRDGDPGIDFVGCGDGMDTAVIDPNDGVQDNCENVDRGVVQPPPPPPPDGPAPPPPPPPPGNPPPTTPGGPTTVAVAAVRGQTLGSFLHRGLRVRVTCPRACRATLRILVSRRTARRRRLDSPVIASGFARLTRTGRVTAVVEPRPGVRRRLRTVRRLQITVEARVTPTGQRTRPHRFELTLRRGTAT